jgi:hypothetical protein
MIDARLVAMQGIGGPARSIAMMGLSPAASAPPVVIKPSGSVGPAVYSPGRLLSSYYDDVNKKYEIPVDVDLDEEDDVIITILIKLARHVL